MGKNEKTSKKKNGASNVAALRRDIDALRAEVDSLRRGGGTAPAPAAGAPPSSDAVLSFEEANAAFAEALREKIQSEVAEKNTAQGGIGVGLITVQTNTKGSTGTAFSIITLNDASDLPDDDKIAEKIGRVRALVDDPLTLRALRCLAEPYFAAGPMRSTRQALAERLGATEDALANALRSLVADNSLQRGLTPDGLEYYQWNGNGLPAVLLIHG